jgi:hypothetical protein
VDLSDHQHLQDHRMDLTFRRGQLPAGDCGRLVGQRGVTHQRGITHRAGILKIFESQRAFKKARPAGKQRQPDT